MKKRNLATSTAQRMKFPFNYGRYLLIGGALTAGACLMTKTYSLTPFSLSFSSPYQVQAVQAAQEVDQEPDHAYGDEVLDYFHLLDTLRDLAPKIDAKKMLKLFLKEFNTEGHDHVTEEFVIDLFGKVGIDSPEVAQHLFQLFDWNGNGKLEPPELAAAFTLFQVGTPLERYRFLFHCLDLDQSKSVDKQEFRAFLTVLLEAKYRLSGLSHYRDPDELYIDISISEYRTIAKIKSNALVREIFLFADQNRDGELSMKEFLHWCKRGGHQVEVLQDLLSHIVDDALYSSLEK
jgi:Ca2+-binding EF-hand superfamily protein